MTDSQQKIAARVVRILALLTSAWAIVLLINTQARNDTAGYLMLVLGPLIMLGARWIDPASKSSPQADLPDASSAEAAPSQETSSEDATEPASKDPH